MTLDEVNQYPIPTGWHWAALSDITFIRDRDHRTPTYVSDGVPLISPRDFTRSGIDKANLKFVTQDELTAFRKKCDPEIGDILFSRIGTIGEARLLDFDHDFVALHSIALIKRRSADIDPKYLLYLMQSPFVQSQARQGIKSLGTPDLGLKRMNQFRVPVAPRNTQIAVAAKIDELLSDLDFGVAALERARANLKRYRAAVLKAAVEGKLTEQWRKAHPDVEPASGLLERILAERRRKWEDAQLARFTAQGKQPPKSWKGKYPEPAKPDTSNLPELPNGWCWTHIEQLCEFGAHALKAGPFGSSIKKSIYVPTGYKIYGQEQVIRGDPSYGDYYINQEKFDELKSCAIKPGDLLISLVGTIGRTLVLPQDCEPGIINPRLIKASLDRELVLPVFVQSYLKSPQVRAVFKLVSHGGTMEILNMGTLTALAYPLLPKAEQLAIVNEIAAADSVVDHVDKALDGQFNTTIRLRQSILKRAFEGKLVPQDPNDEPASVLLERIRAACPPSEKKGRRARAINVEDL